MTKQRKKREEVAVESRFKGRVMLPQLTEDECKVVEDYRTGFPFRLSRSEAIRAAAMEHMRAAIAERKKVA